MKKSKQGEGTLLLSVILSAPGPIILAAALLYGRSSTQMADFIRRTLEFLALVVSYAVFRYMARKNLMDREKDRLQKIADLFVGGSMCLSGPVILFLSIWSFGQEKGNVVPGLVIALLGVLANGIFTLRYGVLYQKEAHAIFFIQRKLYQAKFLVDLAMTGSLALVLFYPGNKGTDWTDFLGSLLVSCYLLYSGYKIIVEKVLKNPFK